VKVKTEAISFKDQEINQSNLENEDKTASLDKYFELDSEKLIEKQNSNTID